MNSTVGRPSYRPRLAEEGILRKLDALGAVLVEGPKACGKTWTARRLAASEVLLDHQSDAAQALAVSPGLILDGARPRLIDEWQRVPAVWDAVRRTVDDSGSAGQFILTGSATPSDDPQRHPGAGRFATHRMRPMTLVEQQVTAPTVSLGGLLHGVAQQPTTSDVTVEQYAEYIVRGGWPQLLDASPRRAADFVGAYLDNLVEVDIPQATGVRRDPRMVRRFLLAYAQLTAHPAPLARIVERARGRADDGPSRWTAEPYLDALRRLMVVDEVAAWNPSLRSRSALVSYPKRHLVDPSLAAYLMGASQERLIADLNTLGFLFESLVTRDIQVYADTVGASIAHYREAGGRFEIDLVVEDRSGAWVGVEVKLGGAAAIDAAAAALRRLDQDRVGVRAAALVVVTAGQYAYRREDDVWVVPLACLAP
ncbi:MAG: DUF4143 domain-containing protein [Micrococcales bacterium]|nr:DUF4143 domain-containing protein [Micrococcales bacterium]